MKDPLFVRCVNAEFADDPINATRTESVMVLMALSGSTFDVGVVYIFKILEVFRAGLCLSENVRLQIDSMSSIDEQAERSFHLISEANGFV